MWISIFHYWWVPAVFLMYSISTFLSVHAKEGWKWVAGLYLLQCFGFWPIVARYSKNLAADGLLFDFLMIVSFYSTLFLMSQMQELSIMQWVGLLMAVVGIFLMKGII